MSFLFQDYKLHCPSSQSCLKRVPFYFAHYIIKAVLCPRNSSIGTEVLNIFDREVENCLNVNYIKVKQSLYRCLLQTKRFAGGWGSHISRQTAREGVTHRPPLLPRKYSWYRFLL